MGIAEAIAARNSVPCNIPVIGDSITEGQGASTFANRWINQASIAARALYPTTGNGSNGGLGFIPVTGTGSNSFTWPMTGQGGGTILDGPVRAENYFTTGDFAFTAPSPTTSVRIMYYANGTGDQFSYQVNSGTVTTVTDSANTGDGALTSSIPMTSGDVLTVQWVSGTNYIAGVVHYNGDENSGITFHGCGHYGWQFGNTGAFDWNQVGLDQSGFPWPPSLAAFDPAAIGIFLGVNDARNFDSAQFQANGETFINYLQTYPGLNVPLLVIIPYEANESFDDVGGWAAYVTALQNIAAAYPGSTVVNLSALMQPVADDPGYYADTLHPNDEGHALIGGYVAAGLPPPSSTVDDGGDDAPWHIRQRRRR